MKIFLKYLKCFFENFFKNILKNIFPKAIIKVIIKAIKKHTNVVYVIPFAPLNILQSTKHEHQNAKCFNKARTQAKNTSIK
jgi:hypothetical protein